MKTRAGDWEQVIPCGKLPPSMLQEIVLDVFHQGEDDSIAVGPAPGVDVSIVDLQKKDRLVLSMDPITGCVEDLGRLLVIINTNDLYTSGITPQYMMITLLFPPGTTGRDILQVTQDIQSECLAQEVRVIGGHTEVTAAVNQPVAIATVFGSYSTGTSLPPTVTNAAIPGLHILITKEIAMEGLLLVLSAPHKQLRLSDYIPEGVEALKERLKRGLSVREECVYIRNHHPQGVVGLHDITEGGLLGSLLEISTASDCGFQVHTKDIPIVAEGKQLFLDYGADPYAMISSGSLMILAEGDHVDSLVAGLAEQGIRCSHIGRLLSDREKRCIDDREVVQVEDGIWKLLDRL